MDLHLPHGSIRTLRDFLTHLGIITLGILIALALEQVVEARHRARLGAEAEAGFRRELAENRNQVQEVMAAMPQLRTKIAEQVARLSAIAPATGGAAAPIQYPGITFDLVSTASWDTAVATQALNQIPYARAKRYGEAYGVFRVFLDEELAGLGAWREMRQFGEDETRLTSEQRRALIEQLRRYESQTYVIDMVGKGALQACDQALK